MTHPPLANDRYQIRSLLGEGGCARVFLAHDTVLGVDRAIKILIGDERRRRALRQRFQAEARAMARLGHRNVLQVFDLVREGDEDFIVMQFAPGGSLEAKQREGVLPATTAVRCVREVLSALEVAHAAGIVHRDIKPSNILLDADGTALLADFGIALVDGDALRTTRAGVAMGTIEYMAPEQRVDAAGVNPAADIYAVGATLFSLLTNATAMDLFLLSPESPRWGKVPDALRASIRAATQADPTRRPDAATLGDALGKWSAEQATAEPGSAGRTSGGSETLVPHTIPIEERPLGLGAVTPRSDPTYTGSVDSTPAPGPTSDRGAAIGGRPPEAPSPRAKPPPSEPAKQPTSPPVGTSDPPRRGGWIPAVVALAVAIAVLLAGGWAVWRSWQTGEVPTPAAVTIPSPPPAEVPPTPAEGTLPAPTDVVLVVPAPPVPEPPAPAPVAATRPDPAPGPPPTDAARPEVAPKDPTPDPGVQGPPFGSWNGSFNGNPVTITLTGDPANVRGVVAVTFDVNTVRNRVHGTFEPTDRVLALVDDEGGVDSGGYRLTLSANGQRLTGTHEVPARGTTSQLVLHR